MDGTAQVKAFRLQLSRYKFIYLLVFLFLTVCLIFAYLLCLFVCFDKVVTLALIFLTNGKKWSQLKARGRNALNAQNKEIYTCIILQESWLKACHFSDIDECARNLSCHVNANCTNTIGSHVCTCHTGYTGDGQTCSGDFDNFSSVFRKVLYVRREANFHCCSFYTYNLSYSMREVIWNVFLA